MLKEREFCIVLVQKGHGIGVEETYGADKVVKYDGNYLPVEMD